MSGHLQAGLAVAVAVALHIGLFALQPEPAGAVSSGAGGADLVSLQAADAVLADLVAAWDAPPQMMADLPGDLTSPQATAAPTLSASPDPAPQAMAPMALALAPRAEAPPGADLSLPPPPPPEPVIAQKPEPVAQPKAEAKPKPRPKDKAKPAAKPPSQQATSKTPAKQSSAGQAAQKAAGAGGGAQAGDGGSAESATLSKARRTDLKAGWGATIRSRIERRKSYPSGANGASGSVTVQLTISQSGKLMAVSVAKSSGHAALDQAAVKAVRSAGKFPAAPKGLTEASYSFSLPMKFAR